MSTVASKGGALRGRSPCTREGRRSDRPELQWSVVSGQWSDVRMGVWAAGRGLAFEVGEGDAGTTFYWKSD